MNSREHKLVELSSSSEETDSHQTAEFLVPAKVATTPSAPLPAAIEGVVEAAVRNSDENYNSTGGGATRSGGGRVSVFVIDAVTRPDDSLEELLPVRRWTKGALGDAQSKRRFSIGAKQK